MGQTLSVACMYSEYLCNIGIRNIAASTTEFHDRERTRIFFGHYPAGSSVRCWQHIH